MEDFFENNKRYFVLILGIILILLGIYIIKGYFTILLGSAFLAYLFYPVYKRLNDKIKSDILSASIVIIIVLILSFVPLFFLIHALVKDVSFIYDLILNLNISSSALQNIIINSMDYAKESLLNFLVLIPSKIIGLFVLLFGLYYFLIDGEKIVEKIKDFLPLNKKRKEIIINEFKDVSYAVIYGLVLTAILEGIAAVIGFYIFHVNSPVFWGLLIFISGIIPFFGSSMVWVPIGLWKILNFEYFDGIGILIYGLIIISGIEVVLKQRIISGKAKMHPLITLLGAFGGLSVFGFFGIILGPLILNMGITLLKTIKIWKDEE